MIEEFQNSSIGYSSDDMIMGRIVDDSLSENMIGYGRKKTKK